MENNRRTFLSVLAGLVGLTAARSSEAGIFRRWRCRTRGYQPGKRAVVITGTIPPTPMAMMPFKLKGTCAGDKVHWMVFPSGSVGTDNRPVFCHESCTNPMMPMNSVARGIANCEDSAWQSGDITLPMGSYVAVAWEEDVNASTGTVTINRSNNFPINL